MKIQSYHSLKEETTFNCGGKARWFCEVEDLAEFKNLLNLHKGKLYILGGGSKTLCADSGFDGLVISTKKLNHITTENQFIICESGVRTDKLLSFCAKNGLSGLEWCAGIPASVGGMAVMNAGAFSHDFAESLFQVEIFENGKTKILNKADITFSYRSSSLKNSNILRVWLSLTKTTPIIVGENVNYYLNKKSTAQPIEKYSAGSVFKRSENVIPAKIIDKLGLKGVKIGGAKVSEKHCGFIVNTGTATATDVIALIDFLKKEVQKTFGIDLENEIIILE